MEAAVSHMQTHANVEGGGRVFWNLSKAGEWFFKWGFQVMSRNDVKPVATPHKHLSPDSTVDAVILSPHSWGVYISVPNHM